MVWVVLALVLGMALGLGVGLLYHVSRRRLCPGCAWKCYFGDLNPLPDPVVHRHFLERVDQALRDLPIYGRPVPGYDCPARRNAVLHNEVAALLGIDTPHQLRDEGTYHSP